MIVVLAAPLLAQIVPPNGMGVSMGHLHIFTPDPDAHRKLWIDVLGGKPVKLGPVELAMFPGVMVGFRQATSSGGTDGSIVNHFGFLVRDLAGTKAKLVAAGVRIEREMPATHQMFAMFPDNVRVEFTEDTTMDIPIKHHHIHFATPQIEEMRAWYAKTFGAVPGMRGRFKAADLPGVNLSWNPADRATAPTRGRALDHIGFEVRGLNAFCDNLKAAGVAVEMGPPGLPLAFLTDPWGTRIELTEALNELK